MFRPLATQDLTPLVRECVEILSASVSEDNLSIVYLEGVIESAVSEFEYLDRGKTRVILGSEERVNSVMRLARFFERNQSRSREDLQYVLREALRVVSKRKSQNFFFKGLVVRRFKQPSPEIGADAFREEEPDISLIPTTTSVSKEKADSHKCPFCFNTINSRNRCEGCGREFEDD
jgi:hypothetical protein